MTPRERKQRIVKLSRIMGILRKLEGLNEAQREIVADIKAELACLAEE